jgi:pimeloyl-ACP methyl ester carboxylesterase
MSKPSVLFVHGMWGTAQVWENYQKHFAAAGVETRAITLRHHDRLISEQPPQELGTTSLADYVDDIVAEVDKCTEAPILIGHSMGGLLVQMVAARTQVRGVIALTPAPPSGVLALRPSTLKLFRRILFTWALWRKPTRLTYEEARFGLYHLLPEQEAQQHHAEMVWESGRATLEIAAWILDKNKTSAFAVEDIECPVLIMAGGLDRTVNEVVCAKAAKRYQGRAKYHVWPDNGHWVLGEPGWQDIADHCLHWIADKA